MRVFANVNRNQSPWQSSATFRVFKVRTRSEKKRRPKSRTPPLANTLFGSLEREINAGADHAEVVVRSVHKVPAEITDPTNVRRETNFHAAANLADCP
jgi:hypothetical protein